MTGFEPITIIPAANDAKPRPTAIKSFGSIPPALNSAARPPIAAVAPMITAIPPIVFGFANVARPFANPAKKE
jgi:hypothetical protein